MLSKIVEVLDRVPEIILIIINICIAAFVILTHGGYLVLTYLQNGEQTSSGFDLIFVSLPLAILIFITCAIGFLKKELRGKILKVHAFVLSLGAIVCFFWATFILLGSFPEGGFAWSPGFLTFLCVYPVYILRRTVFLIKIKKSFFIKYFHVFTFLVVLIIDMSIFVKLINASNAYDLSFKRTKVTNSQENKIREDIAKAWELDNQNRRNESIKISEKALGQAEDLFGEEHPTVAFCLYNLAFFHSREGEYEKAELLYKHALSIQEKFYGENHHEVASTTNNLGFLYLSQGNYVEAERFFKRTLAIKEKSHDPGVIWSLENLANLYCKQARYSDAEVVLLRALSISENLEKSKWGKDHSIIIKVLNRLKDLYGKMGNNEGVEKTEKQIKKFGRFQDVHK